MTEGATAADEPADRARAGGGPVGGRVDGTRVDGTRVDGTRVDGRVVHVTLPGLATPADGDAASMRPAVALVDWQIRDAVEEFGLITEAYEPTSARYATYEAHASDYVQILTYIDGRTIHTSRGVKDGKIWIEPRETVKIYTAEVFNLLDDMYAVVTGLGQLYACGLSIGSTYVDPGSRGPLYLAVTNLTDRSVCIPVGSPIARVQFWYLGAAPAQKHLGHRSRRKMELEAVPRRLTERGHDDAIGRLSRRLQVLSFMLLLQTCAVFGLFWYVYPDLVNRVFNFAAGDDLPPALHFVVPVLAAPVVFFLFRSAWRLIQPVGRRPRDTDTNPDH